MKIGYIGLGKMGKNMTLRLLEQGVKVVVWNRSPEPAEEIAKKGAIRVLSINELVEKLTSPRVIWLMLSQGKPTEMILSKLKLLLDKGDLVIDGGNTYYKDSIRYSKELKKVGVSFMDVGVSGGPSGARNGACLMIGGNKKDYERNKDLFKAIAAKGAYEYFGNVGAGHFIKMVHNGIEYGMMESIAEGAAVLKATEYNFDLAKIFSIYNKRSVIESRLIGWLHEAFVENSSLAGITTKIEHTGEGEWTLKEAKRLGVDIPSIQKAFDVRLHSGKDKPNSFDGFRNKVVSILRNKFGQHEAKFKAGKFG